MPNFKITMIGTNPLLMHSGSLINPLDERSKNLKKLSGKRIKTDDDYEEMARIEHAAGLYFDSEFGPFIPSDNIWRCLYDAAKKHKFGVKVKEGVIITSEVNPLAYDGPRTQDGLWKDTNFRLMSPAKVGMARVMRCRPKFTKWAVEAFGTYDPLVIDFADLQMVAETAGNLIGLGDWRPRYGRFTATVVKA